MKRKILRAGLLCLCLTLPLSVARAGGETLSDHQAATRAKPSAPVELRWLQDGRDGVVEVAVSAAVDHDGLDLMLVLPGGDQQGTRSLPASAAGPAGSVTWTLQQRPVSAPRIMVVIRRDGVRQPRSFLADWQTVQDVVLPDGQTGAQAVDGKNARASGETGVARAESAAPEDGGPEVAMPEPERIESMPAQETLQREAPGGPDEGR